jgi:hypothetical protein
LTLNADKTFTLNHTYAANGVYVVHVQVTDKDGGVGFKEFTVNVGGDTTPPTVSSSQFLFQSGPRKITMTFNEDVSASLTADDLTVHNVDANTDLPAAATTLSWDAASNTATWTFGTLPDANYHATLHASGVSDGAGNPLAADATLDFWFLNGDANRDRSVSFADLVAVAQHYGQVGGGTLAGGDMDGDGNVSFADLVTVAQNYGKTLAALPAAVPAALPASDSTTAPLAGNTPASTPVTSPEASAPALTAAPAPSAVPPLPKPAKPVPVTTNTPPRPATLAVTAPVVVSKPAPVSKPKAAQTPLAPTAFSTTRIGSDVKKRNDLFN